MELFEAEARWMIRQLWRSQIFLVHGRLSHVLAADAGPSDGVSVRHQLLGSRLEVGERVQLSFSGRTQRAATITT